MRRLLRAIFPDQASNFAPQVDYIFFALLALCGAVAFLILIVALFFCIRYRRGSKADRTLSKGTDRKSTRLNSSHVEISYAVFCLKKKKKYNKVIRRP